MTLEAMHRRGLEIRVTAHCGRLRISCPDQLIEIDYPTPAMAETAFKLVDRVSGNFRYGPTVDVFGKPHSREEFVQKFVETVRRMTSFTIHEVAQ